MLMLAVPVSCLLLALLAFATPAAAQRVPRIEEKPCWFTPPRGEKARCLMLTVRENRELESGRLIRLPVAILRARSSVPATDAVIHLSGGPGDSPLSATEPGGDAMNDGDWWNITAEIRRRRDYVIVGQRGAKLSEPELRCEDVDVRRSFLTRVGRPQEAIERERKAMARCAQEIMASGVDLAQYNTISLADDVADLARSLGLRQVNLHGVSYGTRWALEVMRRHPGLVRSAILDAVYPPHVVADDHEGDVVRGVFERLYADCAADARCKRRHPHLRARLEGLIERMEAEPVTLKLSLTDGKVEVAMTGGKVLLTLLHMMRLGGTEIGRLPYVIDRTIRGDYVPLTFYATDLEESEGGLAEDSPPEMAGLYNAVECRENSLLIDSRIRRRNIEANGIYGLVPKLNTAPDTCPLWRVLPAPVAQRQPVRSAIPTLLLSGSYDWLTPPSWAADQMRYLDNARHIEFRALGHATAVHGNCASRLVDYFTLHADPRRLPSCIERNGPPAFIDSLRR
ncbi:MAG: alpha/beta fold hydrolase [Alphaproteobacteria bacterium]|nr:alpha/beta fold hydrolase [Alphaproteobacteria bacterium]